jgi:sec-independent protein translocase protein TatC
MFLLKKVFQLRDKASNAEEKPFLEHLEDLRYTITRIVITLLITTIISFTYRDTLMEILRKPIDEVWNTHSDKKLPSHVMFDVELWEQAKSHADILAHLPEKQQAYFLKKLAPQQTRLMQLFIAYKSAMVLPEESRAEYLSNYPDIIAEDKAFFPELLEKKPNAQLGSRDKFRFMSTLNPTESFMLSMKLAIYAGIVIAFPLLLLFTLQFIVPGLHQNEKKALYPALAVGFGLFLSGVLFAYLWILPSVLEFFYSYGESMGIANEWRIGYYLSFATQFTMIFGLCFELPVVVWVLVKVGLLSYELMSRTRSYAILAIVIISAIVTPTPDAFTLLLLAAPMILLYEMSIWLAWFDARREKKREQAEETERLNRLLAMPAPPLPHGGHEDPDPDIDDFHTDHHHRIHEEYHASDDDHPSVEDHPSSSEPTPPEK